MHHQFAHDCKLLIYLLCIKQVDYGINRFDKKNSKLVQTFTPKDIEGTFDDGTSKFYEYLKTHAFRHGMLIIFSFGFLYIFLILRKGISELESQNNSSNKLEVSDIAIQDLVP